MASVFAELCVDCADHRALATFWRDVLEWDLTEEDDYWYIQHPKGWSPVILFVPVPEGKTVKNRLHIDVSPSDRGQDEEVERIIELGARRIDIGQGDVTWVVLADPEGNEFCVLRPRP
jgi:predicted enzyme related to lactoylglutathione lyase